MDTFYITTPIYFPNDELHIGSSYTTIAADTMARYKRARGYDVKFLTGLDEHGQKVEAAANERGRTPKEHVDAVSAATKSLWAALCIEYDIFWRTTDPRHEAAIQKIFRRLYEQDDIYKGSYEGLYCKSCESFYKESQLVNGLCPDLGHPVERIKEECYFLRLSKYQDRLMRHIAENPSFMLPEHRRNEMVNNFLKPGLDDLCVSRSTFRWGVPVDFDPDHVVYVWVDALPNYATALGFLSDDDSEYKKYWPADVHVMAKEIYRFHTIVWPIILMALGEPLPKQVFGHGWLMSEGRKMSKSDGNVIYPEELINLYGVDAVRYFLLREFAFGQDGNFTRSALITRINADLANDLGNLLSRTVGMVDKYFGGTLPEPIGCAPAGPYDADLEALVSGMAQSVETHMDRMMFHDALAEIWAVIRRANKYTDENAPWIMYKDEAQHQPLANVLYHLAETLRIVAVMISPVMPVTPGIIREQLNITDPSLFEWDSAKRFGLLPRGVRITKGPAAFPRIDKTL